MSEWEKARKEAGKEAKWMEKEVDGYSYRDPKHAEKTDVKYKTFISREINKCRDFLFPMIEAAYMEQDFRSAGALEDVMQWLDVFMLELGLKLEWREEASYKEYVRLIRTDAELLKSTRRLTDIIKKMQEDVLEKGKGGASAVKKSAQMKKYVSDLLLLFKRRRHALGG